MECSNKLYLYQYIDVIRDTLEAGKTFRLDVIGSSMAPTLVEGDRVVLDKPTDLRKKDIILYRVDGEHFVLHRIVKMREGIIARGDNNVGDERVAVEDIIAKVVTIEKGDRRITPHTIIYNNQYMYSVVRRFWRRVKSRLRR